MFFNKLVTESPRFGSVVYMQVESTLLVCKMNAWFTFPILFSSERCGSKSSLGKLMRRRTPNYPPAKTQAKTIPLMARSFMLSSAKLDAGSRAV
jgi:hypothetical protein